MRVISLIRGKNIKRDHSRDFQKRSEIAKKFDTSVDSVPKINLFFSIKQHSHHRRDGPPAYCHHWIWWSICSSWYYYGVCHCDNEDTSDLKVGERAAAAIAGDIIQIDMMTSVMKHILAIEVIIKISL